jgi:hypothetical protein
MKKILFSIIWLLLLTGTEQAMANLLLNHGFEEAGTTSEDAVNWQWGNPFINGGRWGTAARRDWHVRTGSWGATIQGSWAGGQGGGWWQEVRATPGVAYTFSCWFKADSNWVNQEDQGIKIEFYTGEHNGTTMISDQRLYFDGVGEAWVQKTVSAVAPPDAQWVRVIIWADGVGQYGAIHFDDAALVAEPGTVIIISSASAVLIAMCMAGSVYRRVTSRC